MENGFGKALHKELEILREHDGKIHLWEAINVTAVFSLLIASIVRFIVNITPSVKKLKKEISIAQREREKMLSTCTEFQFKEDLSYMRWFDWIYGGKGRYFNRCSQSL